jgi:hypothetical protein
MGARSARVVSMGGDIRRDQLNMVVHEVLHVVMNIPLTW